MRDKLLTVTEVANDLRVTRETIRNLIDRGELRAFRVGNQWRVPTAAVEQLVQRSTNTAAGGQTK